MNEVARFFRFMRKTTQGSLFDQPAGEPAPIKPRGIQAEPKKGMPLKPKMGGVSKPATKEAASKQGEIQFSTPPMEKPEIGDTRIVDGNEYIFRETTPQKPRWHSPEEIEKEEAERAGRERMTRPVPPPTNPDREDLFSQPPMKPTTKMPKDMSRVEFEKLAFRQNQDGKRIVNGEHLRAWKNGEGKWNVSWMGTPVLESLNLKEAQEFLKDPFKALGGQDEQGIKGDEVVKQAGAEMKAEESPVDEGAKIGDRKFENGREYILLETTPGKPRWHTIPEAEDLLGLKHGTLDLVKAIHDKLAKGDGFKNNPELWDMAEKAFGGGIVSGKWGSADAYDALEAAVNQILSEQGEELMKMPMDEAYDKLEELVKKLPTQNVRSNEKEEYQQFSTPPTYAYLLVKAGNISGKDLFLEPSAGVGSIAVLARAAGAKVVTNELADRRNGLLQVLGFPTNKVNGEFLDDLLPDDVQPSVIGMNPPFSATAGRLKNHSTEYGLRHVESALRRLQEGGRLVAILGESAGFDRQSVRTWWDKIMEKYDVRANMSIGGDKYAKYGTTFGIQLAVIDKTGPTEGEDLTQKLQNIYWKGYKDPKEALDDVRKIAGTRNEPAGGLDANAGSPGVSIREGDGKTGGGSGRDEPSGGGRSQSDVADRTSEGNRGISESKSGREPGGAIAGEGRVPGGGEDFTNVRGTELKQNYKPNPEANSRTTEGGMFVSYVPAKLTSEGLTNHPANIVESKSMAAIEPPDITYVPSDAIAQAARRGDLSNVQLEAILYAGQAHEKHLADGKRQGFFIGDGTGVGKGREIAGIIIDNWHQGRQRAVWVSASADLKEAAKVDMDDLRAQEIPLQLINDYKQDADIELSKGVVFTTYSSFARPERLDQLKKWLGTDGVIVFDEAHKAKNALASGPMGKPTLQGEAVTKIQDQLPEARIVYSSATGASEVRNMAYQTRLGLWGEGTPFKSGFTEFMNEIDNGGVGAMEIVAGDLKALGKYCSRNISMEGVEYENAEHPLDNEQTGMYDVAAKGWQTVLQNVYEALDITNSDGWGKSRALTNFWASHQRFFKSILTAFKVPTIIKQAEEQLKAGNSVVISLKSTGESRTQQKVTDALASGEDLGDLDFTPREVLASMIDKSFPTQQFIEQQDPLTGKVIKVPMKNKDGSPVQSKEALAMKKRLLESLSDLDLPDNPLDQLVNHFSLRSRELNEPAYEVAELTGRKKRLMKEIGKHPTTGKPYHTGKVGYVKRAPEGVPMKKINLHEMENFQSGKKRIAIISEAASTGISLHASNRALNKQKRVQIAAEIGWSSDKELQTQGRTHRADQAYDPHYISVVSNAGGEKRFESTLAKRMASLGALVKGQRDAMGGGQDLAKYDLENDYGKAALTSFYDNIMHGYDVEGMEKPKQALRDMGVLKPKKDGFGEVIEEEDRTNVSRFLNRVLALDLGRQNALFDNFYNTFTGLVASAKEKGTFDDGATDIKGEKVELAAKPSVVHTDKVTGAYTTHYAVNVTSKVEPITAEKLQAYQRKAAGQYYKQTRSGNIVFAREPVTRTDPSSGRVTKAFPLTKPQQWSAGTITEDELSKKFVPVMDAEGEQWWNDKIKELPATKTEEMHIISGAILPIWDKLKQSEAERLQIVRLRTDGGQRIAGVMIPRESVGSVLKALGVHRQREATPEATFGRVLNDGDEVRLADGLLLKPSLLQGDDVIEVRVPRSYMFDSLRRLGLINEKINWKERFFIPADPEKGIEVMKKLLAEYPMEEETEEAKENDE